MLMARQSRRRFVRSIGATAVGGLAGFAGCSGGGKRADPGETTTKPPGAIPGSEYPTIDRWLTAEQYGGVTDSYEGYLRDMRDADSPTIAVGAEGNTGHFAFDPPAVVVSAGTTIEWQWTGKDGPHSVEAKPEEQLGKSDYEFSSGQPQSGEEVTFTRTMGEPGIALYHCDPHLAVGMKGGVAVE